MKRRIIIIAAIIVTVIILIRLLNQVLVTHFLKKVDYYNSIKKTNQIKYYYLIEADSSVREALFIENIKYKDSLIDYYKKINKGINPIFNFKSHPIPIDTAIYVIEYLKEDTNIAKILFHYRVEYCNEENKVAYVYSKLLHDKKYKIK